MTSDVDVARWLDEEFPASVPDDLLDRVIEATSQTRPRPRLFARLSGHHLPPQPSPPLVMRPRKDRQMNRRLALVAVVAAIVLAAAFGLSRLAPSPEGPAATSPPSPILPTASVAPDSTIGRLDAGTYRSVSFRPGFQFTVPAGWEKNDDDRLSFGLHGPDGGPTGVYCPDSGPNWADSCLHHDNVIVMTGDRALGTDAQDCEGLAMAASPSSVDGMLAALLADPRFAVNVRGSVDIGGLTGQRLFLSLDKDWTGTCKWSGGKPAALVLTAARPPGPFVGVIRWEELDLTLLDSPGGVLAITMDSRYRENSLPIVESFVFDR